MTTSNKRHICTRPFEWFEIHPDGSVFCCCPAWLKRPIGNLLRQSVEEIWNGAVAQEIRKSILNGSFHNCSKQRCPFLHNRSEPVCLPEQIEDAELSEAIAQQQVELPHPRHLNLCFDHSCNLACPSCRKDIRQATGVELQRAEQLRSCIETELLPHARRVTLSGFGDPFGSPTYLKLLRNLDRQRYPHLQQVRLHSNGQLLDQAMWHSLPGLQPLVSEIEISIDAASDATYRRNRPGGSFARLLQNLEFLATTGVELKLSMVVQANNWRELPALTELGQRFGASLYLSQLVNWGTYNKAEFHRRAIHRPEHPEHPELLRFLRTIQKSDIDFGNLAPLLAQFN